MFTFHDIVEPDLVFVAGDQLEIMTEKNIQGAPAIVVEVVSKSTRSATNESRRSSSIAAACGSTWIVDPERSQVIVHRREGGGLDRAHTAVGAPTRVLTTPLIPGFSLAVSELFKPSM